MADNDRICPEGPGGNTTLINNDEQMIHDRTETAALARVRADGPQEQDFH